MPSPKHKCASPTCDKMVSPQSTYCSSHVPRNPEWIERQANAQKGKKLSEEVKRKISEARSGQVETICQWCGKTFLVKPYRLRKGQGKHCSNACTYAARSGENSPFWNGGKANLTCHQCHKVFVDNACAHQGELIFCSFSCRSIYYKANQKTSATNIERVMESALKDAGFTFSTQTALCNATVADFFLPQDNIAIFCDGDYWHSLPERQERDKRQTETLQAHGIKVLRFWGSDILSNISKCLEIIQEIRQAPLEALPFRQLNLPISE